MIDFDRHYPEDVFAPLSHDELDAIKNALFQHCKVRFPLDRMHAQWARHLAAVARDEEAEQTNIEDGK